MKNLNIQNCLTNKKILLFQVVGKNEICSDLIKIFLTIRAFCNQHVEKRITNFKHRKHAAEM